MVAGSVPISRPPMAFHHRRLGEQQDNKDQSYQKRISRREDLLAHSFGVPHRHAPDTASTAGPTPHALERIEKEGRACAYQQGGRGIVRQQTARLCAPGCRYDTYDAQVCSASRPSPRLRDSRPMLKKVGVKAPPSTNNPEKVAELDGTA